MLRKLDNLKEKRNNNRQSMPGVCLRIIKEKKERTKERVIEREREREREREKEREN